MASNRFVKRLLCLYLVGFSVMACGQSVSSSQTCAGGSSDQFSLVGEVTNKKTFTLETLKGPAGKRIIMSGVALGVMQGLDAGEAPQP